MITTEIRTLQFLPEQKALQKNAAATPLEISSTALMHATSAASSLCSLGKIAFKTNLDILKQSLFVYKNYTKLSKEKKPLSFIGLSLEKSIKKSHELATIAILPFSILKGIDGLEKTSPTNDLNPVLSSSLFSTPKEMDDLQNTCPTTGFNLFPTSLETPLQKALQVLAILTVLKGYYSVKDSFEKTRKAKDSYSFYTQATLTAAESLKHLAKITSSLIPATSSIANTLQHISLIALGGIRFTNEINCTQAVKQLQNLSLDQAFTSLPVHKTSKNIEGKESSETGAVTKI